MTWAKNIHVQSFCQFVEIHSYDCHNKQKIYMYQKIYFEENLSL